MSQRKTSPPALAVLLLCLAVFCWGTSYKLSLYSHSEKPQLSVAKLLSEAERPSNAVATAIHSVQAFALSITLLSCFGATPSCKSSRTLSQSSQAAVLKGLLRISTCANRTSALRGPPFLAL